MLTKEAFNILLNLSIILLFFSDIFIKILLHPNIIIITKIFFQYFCSFIFYNCIFGLFEIYFGIFGVRLKSSSHFFPNLYRFRNIQSIQTKMFSNLYYALAQLTSFCNDNEYDVPIFLLLFLEGRYYNLLLYYHFLYKLSP